MVSVLFFAVELEPVPEPELELEPAPAVQPAVSRPAAAAITAYLLRRLMPFGPYCRVVLTIRAAPHRPAACGAGCAEVPDSPGRPRPVLADAGECTWLSCCLWCCVLGL